MNDVLGILAFLVFIAAIVGAAAGITWVVVRLNPPKTAGATPPKS